MIASVQPSGSAAREQFERAAAATIRLAAATGCRHWYIIIGQQRPTRVAPHPWAFLRNHPLCRSFDTLEDAVVALVLMQAGKYARMAA
jgi:hypothetical protein